ncbi:MAG: hypothetical protein ACYDC1_07305, partial [Limisphaerales bacterium]
SIVPVEGALLPVTWRGAFADQNWGSDWTALSDYGVITPQGGGNPVIYAQDGEVIAPILAAALQGAEIKITIPTTAGSTYQVQSAASLTNPEWVNQGDPLVGNGEPVVFSQALVAGENRYFRVIAN